MRRRPTRRICRIVIADIKADDLGTLQSTCIAQKQDKLIAKPTQVVGLDIFGKDCFFQHRRSRMLASDLGQHRDEVVVRMKPRCQ
jgi:hypothetical protein